MRGLLVLKILCLILITFYHLSYFLLCNQAHKKLFVAEHRQWKIRFSDQYEISSYIVSI